MKLYELSAKYQQIIENSDVFDEEVLKDTLEALEDDFETSVTELYKVIRAIEGSVDVVSKEIKRLQERKAGMEKTIQSLKKYITDSMKDIGKEKIKNAHVTVWLQKSPMKVAKYDIEKVPNHLVKVEKKLKSSEALKEYKEKLKKWEEEKELAERAGIEFDEPMPEIEGIEFAEGEKGVRFK